MFRHSCGVCHYTNLQRPSDITLADFWGWERNVPGMNDDDKGISLVLLNTKKGEELFEKVCQRIEIREVDINNCLQPNLRNPSKVHKQRDLFENDYKKKGFLFVDKKYGDLGLVNQFRIRVKEMKKRIKKAIKQVNYQF